MSKTIGIKGIYKNGIAVQRGLHCPKNIDSETTKGLFLESEINLLISRFHSEVGNKKLKGNVVVTLNKSGSMPYMASNVFVTVSKDDLYKHADMFARFFQE